MPQLPVAVASTITEVHGRTIRSPTTMLAIDAPFSTTYSVFIVAMASYVLHNAGELNGSRSLDHFWRRDHSNRGSIWSA